MLKREYQNIFENQEIHWWYQGMRQINFSLLRRYLPVKKNLKILEVGCGTGANLSWLANFGSVIGLDISQEALKYARKKGKVKKGDVTALPFRANSFDLVVCLDVLYHSWVKDYSKALLELNRVLKINGFLLLREPSYNWFKSSHDLIDFTARRFNQVKIKNAVKAAGFKILKLSYLNFFLFPLLLIKRLPELLRLKKMKPQSDISSVPKWLDFLLFHVLSTEALFLKYFNFPFGSSLLCLAKKRK